MHTHTESSLSLMAGQQQHQCIYKLFLQWAFFKLSIRTIPQQHHPWQFSPGDCGTLVLQPLSSHWWLLGYLQICGWYQGPRHKARATYTPPPQCCSCPPCLSSLPATNMMCKREAGMLSYLDAPDVGHEVDIPPLCPCLFSPDIVSAWLKERLNHMQTEIT